MSDDASDGWDDDWEDAEVNRPVICPSCGVSALPPERPGEPPVCENGGCDAYGEPVY